MQPTAADLCAIVMMDPAISVEFDHADPQADRMILHCLTLAYEEWDYRQGGDQMVCLANLPEAVVAEAVSILSAIDTEARRVVAEEIDDWAFEAHCQRNDYRRGLGA
jgi:hypothetical protein